MRTIFCLFVTVFFMSCGLEDKLQNGDCRDDDSGNSGSTLDLKLRGDSSSENSENSDFEDQSCSSNKSSDSSQSKTPTSNGGQNRDKQSNETREDKQSNQGEDFQRDEKSFDASAEEPYEDDPNQYTYTDENGFLIRKTQDPATGDWTKEYWDEDQEAWIEMDYP